jgi:hypothetical protein
MKFFLSLFFFCSGLALAALNGLNIKIPENTLKCEGKDYFPHVETLEKHVANYHRIVQDLKVVRMQLSNPSRYPKAPEIRDGIHKTLFRIDMSLLKLFSKKDLACMQIELKDRLEKSREAHNALMDEDRPNLRQLVSANLLIAKLRYLSFFAFHLEIHWTLIENNGFNKFKNTIWSPWVFEMDIKNLPY